MVRSIAEVRSLKNAQPGRISHADRAMNVLQYGTAIVAIVVVTLLAINH